MMVVRENQKEPPGTADEKCIPHFFLSEEGHRLAQQADGRGTFAYPVETKENVKIRSSNSNYTTILPLSTNTQVKSGSRIIKMIRPIPIKGTPTENSFLVQRESDVELDSDFSMEDSDDEESRDRPERFKTVLKVIRREGRIIHEKMKIHVNKNVDSPPSSPRPTPKLSAKRSQFTCMDCVASGIHMAVANRADFIQHLFRTHSIRLEENIYVFQNLDHFITFKARTESKHRCVFVLRCKKGNELIFECSRSGRYRGENAPCGAWAGRSTQAQGAHILRPLSRCTARMVVIKGGSGKPGLVEANVCATHYGHSEDAERLNLSRRVAVRVAQIARNGGKSSKEIFQALAGGAGARALSRDAVKSVIGFMRRNGGRFDYSAWQEELFNTHCNTDATSNDCFSNLFEAIAETTSMNSIKTNCKAVQSMRGANERLSADGLQRSFQVIDFTSNGSTHEEKGGLLLVGGNDSDWEASSDGSCETVNVSEDQDMICEPQEEESPHVVIQFNEKPRQRSPQFPLTAETRVVRSVKGNVIVIHGREGSVNRPEECVRSVNARQALREAPEMAEALQNNEAENAVLVAQAEVTDEDSRVLSERVVCEDLVGDKMGGVLIENEEVASDLLREIFDEGRLALVGRQSASFPCSSTSHTNISETGSNSTISNSNTTTATTNTGTTTSNNSNSNNTNTSDETSRSQAGQGDQNNSNGTSGGQNNSENGSSAAKGQTGQPATVASAKEKTVAVGKIIEARLKDTLHLSDQEQALKRSIEQAIFTNPVRYQPPRVVSVPGPPPSGLLGRKGSSSEEESSEGEQPEVEPPPPPPKPSKANTKFGKALASAERLQHQQQHAQSAGHATKNHASTIAEKRKVASSTGYPEDGPRCKVATVIKKIEELTEAQKAHEYRDRLMSAMHSPAVIKLMPGTPSVVMAHGSALASGSSSASGALPLTMIPRHDPKAPSPSGSTPHGKKRLAVQATDRSKLSNMNK
ncbi:hypothetical protein BIW11_09418 [Tropilaelaps mercedesae]|uniref:C2H2-type domain-containing protein n=1 Tax=Tropilaelaps mercedesae TaxID=418985 RepID=A0A1V9XK59_9ACAR|nr:hypothetical protein BIW11_09418 [Tropilaelaps mercedesae]